jgi:hypothetical protein
MQAHAQVVPLFRGTFLQMWFYRAMGAKIGKNCVIESLLIHDFDLLEIGDGTGVYVVCPKFLHKGEACRGNRATFSSVHWVSGAAQQANSSGGAKPKQTCAVAISVASAPVSCAALKKGHPWPCFRLALQSILVGSAIVSGL